MTDHDRQLEQQLRDQARRDRNAQLVLADFYETRGAPSRAALWRQEGKRHKRQEPDYLVRDPRWQRKVMMWLIGNYASRPQVGTLFRSSPSWTRTQIQEVETRICEAANAERHDPTIAATQRLQAAGALPRQFDRGAFWLGDVPPESWPMTRLEVRRRELSKLRDVVFDPPGKERTRA